MKNKILIVLLLAMVMALLCSCENSKVGVNDKETVINEQNNAAGGDNTSNDTDDKGIAINEDSFPDGDFRAYVSGFDANGNGILDSGELANVKRIEVANTEEQHHEIGSLEGIKYFTELEYLDCGGNQLTSLDVSDMTSLKELLANSNQLASLNISGCHKLEKLACEVNSLTSLDVSVCSELKILYCINNRLPSLDISSCTELEQLVCISNLLTELDVSRCTKLVRLACDDNKLTSLDLSGCPELEELTCEYNEITELDLSKCPKLAENMFYCDEGVNVIK